MLSRLTVLLEKPYWWLFIEYFTKRLDQSDRTVTQRWCVLTFENRHNTCNFEWLWNTPSEMLRALMWESSATMSCDTNLNSFKCWYHLVFHISTPSPHSPSQPCYPWPPFPLPTSPLSFAYLPATPPPPLSPAPSRKRGNLTLES